MRRGWKTSLAFAGVVMFLSAACAVISWTAIIDNSLAVTTTVPVVRTSSVQTITPTTAPSTTTTVKPSPTTTQAPRKPVPATSPVSPPTSEAPAAPRPPDGADYHTWWDWGVWVQLGHCEEPGGPPDGINWATNTGVYVGGFAMAHSSYDLAARNAGLASWDADHAPKTLGTQIPSPGEQILVARWGHYVGHFYWGCGKLVNGW